MSALFKIRSLEAIACAVIQTPGVDVRLHGIVVRLCEPAAAVAGSGIRPTTDEQPRLNRSFLCARQSLRPALEV